jgi:hypothetical protein
MARQRLKRETASLSPRLETSTVRITLLHERFFAWEKRMKSPIAIRLIGLLCCLPLTATSAQAAHTTPPSGPPPMPTRVIVQDGTLYRQQALFVPETRMRLVEVDGMKREEVYTVMMPQSQVASTPKDGYRVYTIEGQPLTDAEVATALAKETEVLHSIHGKLIDPRYRPLYAPKTLIIYLRPEFAFPGYGAPPSPGQPAKQPPTFSSSPAPKGLPPSVGFLTDNGGGEVVLTEYRWDMVSEYKPVHFEMKDSNGNPSTVTKVVSQVHWVPEPIETRLKSAELTSVDRSGNRTHGLADELSEEPLAVFLHDAASEFDPGHFKLCQPHVVVIQGKFPMERLMTSYGAPPAPVEAFASVKDDHLIVGKMISESITEQREVTVIKDGKEAIQLITEARTVHKWVHQRLELAAVKAQDASGKALDADELKQRLATETPVMTAVGDEPVDPMYLVPLKPDTIVLTLPPLQAPPAAAPPPPSGGAPQAAAPAESPVSSLFVAAQAPAAIDPGAQSPPKSPAEGLPPRLVKVQAFGDKLVLREPKTMFGYAPVAEPKPGEPRQQPKPKAMTHVNSRVLDASAFRLYEVDGRPMDPAIFAECAARPIMALLSDHGKKVNPAWLSIYNPGALVVYVRPEVLGMHAMPVPVAPREAPPPPADSPAPPAADSPPPIPAKGA